MAHRLSMSGNEQRLQQCARARLLLLRSCSQAAVAAALLKSVAACNTQCVLCPLLCQLLRQPTTTDRSGYLVLERGARCTYLKLIGLNHTVAANGTRTVAPPGTQKDGKVPGNAQTQALHLHAALAPPPLLWRLLRSHASDLMRSRVSQDSSVWVQPPPN